MKRRNLILGAVGLIVLCFVVSAIIGAVRMSTPEGQAAATAETVAKAAEEVERTATASAKEVERTATASAKATEKARPTDTPAPTKTPAPTNTPAPTDTPQPTLTPTPLPEPIMYSGSGDDIIDVEKPPGLTIAHITGNAASRHFAVTSLDSEGNTLELLANTTEPYDGTRPLDFLAGQNTTRFEVAATGDWTIEILPLPMADVIDVPGSFAGNGDRVLILGAGVPDTAHIVGNAAGRHFAVLGYGPSFPDLLVNTTEPYDGRVIVRGDTLVLEVVAADEWTIDFE